MFESLRPDHLTVKKPITCPVVGFSFFPPPCLSFDVYLTFQIFWLLLMCLQVQCLRCKVYTVKVFKEEIVMSEIDSLREQIEKTKIILVESQENFERNPNSYSARLLLMSIEGYLADLLMKREKLKDQT